MKPTPRCSTFAKFAICLLAILAMAFSFLSSANAQPPPVPSLFQPTYTELDNDLINFNATLPPASVPAYPTLMTAPLKASDANNGPGLLSGTSGAQLSASGGAQLQLNALKAIGVQAILVEIGFPMLYTPFLASQDPTYPQQFANYYQAVANAVRAAGLKLVIENDTLLVSDVAAKWDVAPFYATLNWTQYQAARAQTAVTIAELMQPDYMVLLQEPATEADDSGQSEANTTSGSLSLLSQILASVQQAAVPGVSVGAGTGTSQTNPDALAFIQEYVTLPVDFIDIHIYPINYDFLPIALQMASTAAAAGLPVSMSECWMWKVLNTELNVLSPSEVRARNPFSFWAPLDSYFLQTMQSLANNTQMLFLDPFGEEYYFAYQTYGPATENLTPTQILGQENALVQTANQTALPDTTTGMSWYNSIIVPPDTTPPTAPTGLAGGSGNPTELFLNWNAATDNVGVSGYYVFRNGENIGTTGTLYYQDSGLTEATVYTYMLEAFDLAGNVSLPSAPVDVQTTNVTPPTTPGNVVANAVACTKAIVTWSASTDNTGVTEYLVWMGLSPNSLAQVAVVGGSTTSYGDNTLSAATTYYFGVQAEDKNRNISAMSAIASATTPALPVAPSGVLAEADSTSKISVTWSASTGGLPIARYLVYRGASVATLAQVAVVINTSYTDTSAAASTTYYYAVEAVDSGTPPAQSGLSLPASATTFSPPSAPANVTATPVSSSKIDLTWSASTSGGLPIANYHVYGGTSPSSLSQIVITLNTSYNNVSLTAGTTYYYAVQAADTAYDDSALSNTVAATTLQLPSAPSNVVAQGTSSSEIAVSWSPSSGALPIAYYYVFRGASPSNMSQVATTVNPSYNDKSLSVGTTYYYGVQAVDTAGDLSPVSSAVPGTTL